MGINILVIEDDADIREGIRILLTSEGYHVTEAESGEEGLAKLDDSCDLIILDIMMPGMNGIAVCEQVRKVSFVPVLFLTARSGESDKMLGLMAGGDDYLTKPFSYAELLGRVKALTRRYREYNSGREKPAEEDLLTVSGISLSEHHTRALVKGRSVELTDLEHRILMLLMKHPGQVFSAEQLYEAVWNEPYRYASNNTVMVHIRKLRVKIEETPEDPVHIQTVWGKGYRFE